MELHRELERALKNRTAGAEIKDPLFVVREFVGVEGQFEEKEFLNLIEELGKLDPFLAFRYLLRRYFEQILSSSKDKSTQNGFAFWLDPQSVDGSGQKVLLLTETVPSIFVMRLLGGSHLALYQIRGSARKFREGKKGLNLSVVDSQDLDFIEFVSKGFVEQTSALAGSLGRLYIGVFSEALRITKQYVISRQQGGRALIAWSSISEALERLESELRVGILAHQGALNLEDRKTALQFLANQARRQMAELMDLMGGAGYMKDYPLTEFFEFVHYASIFELPGEAKF